MTSLFSRWMVVVGSAGGCAAGCSSASSETSDSGAGVSPSAAVVVLDTGPVRGTQENGVGAYLGIPYAAPPVGALRWTTTQPHAAWTTPFDATAFGAACMQAFPAPAGFALGGQEDCLTANVWTPASATAASKLPVLVFIHGGGNIEGSSGQQGLLGLGEGPSYDGAALAAKENVVVVTFNYRLGPLGFLALPAFGADAGNYGLRDQIFALGWVQRNAAVFGGDPNRVLLFGQSAGGTDTCSLVASPMAKGLFSAAIMESGGCFFLPASDAHTFALGWAQKAGCGSATDVVGCLRALDPNTVALVQPEMPTTSDDYPPSVDGAVLPDAPLEIIRAGTHNHVPLVFGSNSDENSRASRRSYPQGMTTEEYASNVLALMGGNATLANAVLALYPAGDYPTPLDAYSQVTTDRNFTSIVTLGACVAAMGQTDAPVWRYFFTHRLESGDPFGAWHGLELAFVFRHLATSNYTPSAGEQTLTDTIEDDWASIAATGAPRGSPAWPPYVPGTDPYVQLDDTVTTGAGLRADKVRFWNAMFWTANKHDPTCP